MSCLGNAWDGWKIVDCVRAICRPPVLWQTGRAWCRSDRRDRGEWPIRWREWSVRESGEIASALVAMSLRAERGAEWVVWLSPVGDGALRGPGVEPRIVLGRGQCRGVSWPHGWTYARRLGELSGNDLSSCRASRRT